MQVGDKIVAVGSPLGFQNTMSEGIVSALRNGVLQISAPISPGSSGGAVFDEHGKVIGVSAAQMVWDKTSTSLSRSIGQSPYLNSQSPRPLSDVVAENTVSTSVMNGSMTVPPRQVRSWNIPVNRKPGQCGTGWSDFFGRRYGWKDHIDVGVSGAANLLLPATCEIHQSITSPGVYTLILDNQISPIFAPVK